MFACVMQYIDWNRIMIYRRNIFIICQNLYIREYKVTYILYIHMYDVYMYMRYAEDKHGNGYFVKFLSDREIFATSERILNFITDIS